MNSSKMLCFFIFSVVSVVFFALPSFFLHHQYGDKIFFLFPIVIYAFSYMGIYLFTRELSEKIVGESWGREYADIGNNYVILSKLFIYTFHLIFMTVVGSFFLFWPALVFTFLLSNGIIANIPIINILSTLSCIGYFIYYFRKHLGTLIMDVHINLMFFLFKKNKGKPLIYTLEGFLVEKNDPNEGVKFEERLRIVNTETIKVFEEGVKEEKTEKKKDKIHNKTTSYGKIFTMFVLPIVLSTFSGVLTYIITHTLFGFGTLEASVGSVLAALVLGVIGYRA